MGRTFIKIGSSRGTFRYFWRVGGHCQHRFNFASWMCVYLHEQETRRLSSVDKTQKLQNARKSHYGKRLFSLTICKCKLILSQNLDYSLTFGQACLLYKNFYLWKNNQFANFLFHITVGVGTW